MADEILERIRNFEPITTFDIGIIAQKYYYSPTNLSLIASITQFVQTEKPFRDEEGKFTEELLQYSQELVDIPELRPDELIRKYQIKRRVFGPSWIHNFLKRHNLSYRKAHIEKRGSINEEFVHNFFRELALALKEYGPKRVFNMDETFIRLRNFSDFVIAEKGQKVIKVQSNSEVNEKLGTTFLASISMDPHEKVPLVCVVQGKTQTSARKYHIERPEDGVSFLSSKGWTTSDVMMQYLRCISRRDLTLQLFLMYILHIEKMIN